MEQTHQQNDANSSPNPAGISEAAQTTNAITQDELKLKLPPWFEFKQRLFEIYDHRIYHAPEANGGTNASYLALDEHLICFFIEKTGTRPKAENELCRFLASLKYYSEAWQRAKTFAILYGFLNNDETLSSLPQNATLDSRLMQQRLNDGRIQETTLPQYDIYAQEFFLHAYSLVTRDRRQVAEYKDGYTYLPSKTEERVSSKLLTFILPNQMTKWNMAIQRFVVKIKLDPMDDFDQDYIDVDVLLHKYLELFLNTKKTYQKNLLT